LSNPGRLSADPGNASGGSSCCRSSLFSQAHYLVIDTNVALSQIDLLEAKEGGLTNVILAQTVMEEVRHRSAPIYKRLRDICADVDRRFYIFYNEHHHETYVERLAGETANDRNDRAIRK